MHRKHTEVGQAFAGPCSLRDDSAKLHSATGISSAAVSRTLLFFPHTYLVVGGAIKKAFALSVPPALHSAVRDRYKSPSGVFMAQFLVQSVGFCISAHVFIDHSPVWWRLKKIRSMSDNVLVVLASANMQSRMIHM